MWSSSFHCKKIFTVALSLLTHSNNFYHNFGKQLITWTLNWSTTWNVALTARFGTVHYTKQYELILCFFPSQRTKSDSSLIPLFLSVSFQIYPITRKDVQTSCRPSGVQFGGSKSFPRWIPWPLLRCPSLRQVLPWTTGWLLAANLKWVDIQKLNLNICIYVNLINF